VIDNSDLWLKQAGEILQPGVGTRGAGQGSRAVAFATSLLTALYGPESTQLQQFRDGCAAIAKIAPNPVNMDHELLQHAKGTIRNTKAELEAGLIVRLRVAVAGEILAELIGLAKDVMADRTEEAKNAGAVVLAAAYEGLMRRMGEEFAGVTGRPKLEEVINALKTANVLKGGQVGTAQSYLKFRNDSLHADWKNVDRSQVESCLAFSEALVVKHFS
jgi:hypothetical protein